MPPLKNPAAVSEFSCGCVCLTGGFQCFSVVVAECGAGVGGHRGAVGRAEHRAETCCRTGQIRRRYTAGAERCVEADLNLPVISFIVNVEFVI